MKKYGLLFLACLFLFSMWVPATDATAKNVNALDIKWTKSTNVPLDKRWTISFNKEVHKDSDFVKYVYVENTAGEKIPVEVSINAARTKIYVEPVNAYEPGETYKLIINNGLISSGGKKLKDTVVKEFTTEGEDTVTFNTSYKVTNTTDEIQYVTLSEGAYYQVMLDGIEPGDDTGIASSVKKTIQLYPGYTLYSDYVSSGTMQSTNLKNEIKKMDTPFFKALNLHPGQTLNLEAKSDERSATIIVNSGDNKNIVFNDYRTEDDYREEVGYLFEENDRTRNTHSINSYKNTLIENKGETSVQIFVPKQFVKDSIVNKKINLTTFDLQPNETVKIKAGDLEAVKTDAAMLYTMPKEDSSMFMQYDFVHTYVYGLPGYEINHWSFLDTVNNKEDNAYYYYLGQTIFSDSHFLMKNTGESTIHIYGKYLEFEKTNEPVYKKYTIQPKEKVKVNTVLPGDKDYFYVKNKKESLSMNVYLENDNKIEYMGEMVVDYEKLQLPIYEKTIIENTSDQAIEIYGNDTTISYEDYSNNELPYDKIVVNQNDAYTIKNTSASLTTYFVGRSDTSRVNYLDGYNTNYGDIEYKKRELVWDSSRPEYGFGHGFYQVSKDEISIKPDEERYIVNNGHSPLFLFIPKKGLDYSESY